MTSADELRNRLMQKAAAAPAQNSTLRVNINPRVDPTSAGSMRQLNDDLLAEDLFDLSSDVGVPPIPQHPQTAANPAQPISPAHPMPFSQPQASIQQPKAPRQAQQTFADPLYSSPGFDQPDNSGDGSDLKALGEAASQIGDEKNSIKLIVGGVIAVLILAILLLGFMKQSKTKDSGGGTMTSPGTSVTDGYRSPNDVGAGSDATVVVNESLNYSSDLYTDMITISKYMTLDNGVVSCYFSGKLAKYNREVAFEVTPDMYNTYTAGDTLEVSYRVAKFGGVMYCVDIQVI